MRTAAQRAELPTICQKHNLPHEPQGGGKSMGCPACVGLIRRDVQRELANARKWEPLKRGRKRASHQICVPVATGERWPR